MKTFSFLEWLEEGGSKGLRSFALDRSYERISWVYSCVNRIATTASSAPLIFYRGDKSDAIRGDDSKNRITDENDPVSYLFNPPNPPDIPSLKELISRTFIHLGIDGLLFWVFVRKKGQLVDIETKNKMELRPILSEGMSGELIGWAEYGIDGQVKKTYPVNEVLPIRYYNPKDPLGGLSPLFAARLSLEAEFNIAGWNSSFFKSGMKSPLLMKSKGTMTNPQKKELKSEIINYYSGIEGGHGALLVQGGIEVEPLSISPKDVDFINGKKLNREEICFVPGTKIITSTGLKNIEDVKVGDLVLTHQNRYRRVTAEMKRWYSGEVVTLGAKGLDQVTCTPNHPFYTSTFRRRHGRLEPYTSSDWKDAEDVRARERKECGNYKAKAFDCFTIPKIPVSRSIESINLLEVLERPSPVSSASHTSSWIVENGTVRSNINTSKPIPIEIPLDVTFARLLGYFIAEGSAGDFALQWHFGPDEQEYVDEVVQGLRDVFGLEAVTKRTATGLNVSLFNRAVRDIFNECGRGAANKRIPEWAFSAGEEFIDALLQAYINGDGSHAKSNGHEVTGITTRSESLAWQIRLIQWAKGINTSLVKVDVYTTIIGSRKVTSSGPKYQVGWYENLKRGTSYIRFVEGNPHFFVRDKEFSKYKGYVHNLSVEEDESYTTTGGVCHNCAIYGIPPALVGIFEYANYSNVREQIRIFWELTLLPKLSSILDLIQVNILDTEFPGVYAKWDLSEVHGLKRDPADMAIAVKKYREAGVPFKQIAILLNLPQLEPDGTWEPEPVQPSRPRPPAQQPEGDKPEDENEPEEEVAVLISKASRLKDYNTRDLAQADLLCKDVENALSQFGSSIFSVYKRGSQLRHSFWANFWDDLVGNSLRHVMEVSYRDAVGCVSELTNGAKQRLLIAGELRELVYAEVRGYIKNTQTIPSSLVNFLSNSDLRAWSNYLGYNQELAKTLVSGVREQTRYSVFSKTGVKKQVWVCRDNLHAHLHNSELNGEGIYPHSPKLLPRDIVGCTCTTMPIEFS